MYKIRLCESKILWLVSFVLRKNHEPQKTKDGQNQQQVNNTFNCFPEGIYINYIDSFGHGKSRSGQMC